MYAHLNGNLQKQSRDGLDMLYISFFGRGGGMIKVRLTRFSKREVKREEKEGTKKMGKSFFCGHTSWQLANFPIEYDITKTVLELLKNRASRTLNKKSGLLQRFDFCTNLPQNILNPKLFFSMWCCWNYKFDRELERGNISRNVCPPTISLKLNPL